MTMDNSGATFSRFQCDVRNKILKMSIYITISKHLNAVHTLLPSILVYHSTSTVSLFKLFGKKNKKLSCFFFFFFQHCNYISALQSFSRAR